jgi:dTDP-glucose 4,6-dehydratase
VTPIPDPRGAGHDLRYSVDYSKIAALGYRPQVTFEDGLALTVRWYQDNRDWWEPLRERAALA